ncbi:succinyl-diaminopimelate desuccinylase [Phaeovulum vinaykumarii]|uniref:Succinyl-diaminopimelate desuccinylase n=1 Tax=Phaeovulum vinaykumarii TaxID=407234 RepID=A0A1N7KDN6_9RHOB|nr:succinyl-diaminopimelate desuccinylase [Phaeovulum vinaykumarii]SIS59580.1 succinyldiaminopimelate desuccinylase [Phaeovulum vinaykumarii]SOB94156.1 succinyldiaminopimelate desuccinylase [Phaeovulum vinaykumarii]
MSAAPFSPVDPVDLTARLIRCPSVTPADAGALDLAAALLEEAGFAVTRIPRNGVPNLFARWGARDATRRFGFNGHTDVVPVGDGAAWQRDPFGGEIVDGVLWGRGATDMKSGVAAFLAAAVDFVRRTPPADGAVVVTLTGDEEGPARDGTRAILDWMAAQGEGMDVCLVGEPTCPEALGQMMKVGRRGSITAYITAQGVQGHVAYPHRARNPLHGLTALLGRLVTWPLDAGTAHFDPSSLQITTIDCGNPANNVIPAEARATLNIRFNDAHTGTSLSEWLRSHAAAVEEETGIRLSLRTEISGESFLTAPGDFTELVAAAVEAETGLRPEASTSGGTSDARFIKDLCPVVEFGLVGQTMHQVDERVPTAQIETLKAIYGRILAQYFA